ncbi:MAG TPA: MFS transporter [Chthonomonadaceae bacterium]|nr:MFS transporter [Chthonomonadaceae bacterium]
MNAISERVVLGKATRRLIPFLFILYVVAYLDRVNVGFAKLQMGRALHLSDTVFGAGMGIFFLGYFLFEVPSNLILERVGARRWIARIMISWGLIAMAMLFTRDKASFYGLRFLLGLAEAGFFPGIILYLTYWFTAAERARVVALFMTAGTISQVIGSPLSGLLLTVNGHGLAGWQWLFLLEGLPAVLLGFVVLAYLPDGPQTARWLSADEKAWILGRLEAERQSRIQRHFTLREAFTHPAVWLFCLLYFTLALTSYGITFWLPQIIQKAFHLGKEQTAQVGWLAAIPYIAATVGMVLIGMHSDRTRERRWHVTLSALTACVGLVLSALLHSPVPILLAFTVATLGVWGMLGPFWGLTTAFLGSAAAAGGIALINSVGNLGGFVGPYVMGWLRDTTHSFAVGLLALAGTIFLGGLLALIVRREPLSDQAAVSIDERDALLASPSSDAGG